MPHTLQVKDALDQSHATPPGLTEAEAQTRVTRTASNEALAALG